MTIWSHEDPVPGTFNDGAFPLDRRVLVRQTMGELVIEDKATGEVLARWPLGTLLPVPDADFPRTLRLKQAAGEGGRLAIFDQAFNEGLTEWWPGLRRRLVFDKAALRRAASVSLAAIAGFAFFFLALLPVLGQFAADLVPPPMERKVAHVFLRHGDPLLERINLARVCDTETVQPIIDKLVEPLREASGWPEKIGIRVIDDPLPNAATVPGGEIILFKGMLYFARNADELAGILAHEMGHVARRHAVRNLFVTSLNFFGFDQLFGNFSSQLVVHPLSGMMLARREGRGAEYEADRAAIEFLNKAGFKIRPLADILDRVGYLQGEKEVAEGWLATHPLSRTRARMIRDAAPPEPRDHALTAAEFSQLRAICTTEMPKPEAPKTGGDAASRENGPASPAGESDSADEAAADEGGAEAKPEKQKAPAGAGQGADDTGDADAASSGDGETGDQPQDLQTPGLGEWDTGE